MKIIVAGCAGCAARRQALVAAGRIAATIARQAPAAVARQVQTRLDPGSPLAALFEKVRDKTSAKKR